MIQSRPPVLRGASTKWYWMPWSVPLRRFCVPSFRKRIFQLVPCHTVQKPVIIKKFIYGFGSISQNKHREFSIHSRVSIVYNGNVTQVAHRLKSWVPKSLKDRNIQSSISQQNINKNRQKVHHTNTVRIRPGGHNKQWNTALGRSPYLKQNKDNDIFISQNYFGKTYARLKLLWT
jgi:hypothetical protein